MTAATGLILGEILAGVWGERNGRYRIRPPGRQALSSPFDSRFVHRPPIPAPVDQHRSLIAGLKVTLFPEDHVEVRQQSAGNLSRRRSLRRVPASLHAVVDDATVVDVSGHATRMDGERSHSCSNEPWRLAWKITSSRPRIPASAERFRRCERNCAQNEGRRRSDSH